MTGRPPDFVPVVLYVRKPGENKSPFKSIPRIQKISYLDEWWRWNTFVILPLNKHLLFLYAMKVVHWPWDVLILPFSQKKALQFSFQGYTKTNNRAQMSCPQQCQCHRYIFAYRPILSIQKKGCILFSLCVILWLYLVKFFHRKSFQKQRRPFIKTLAAGSLLLKEAQQNILVFALKLAPSLPYQCQWAHRKLGVRCDHRTAKRAVVPSLCLCALVCVELKYITIYTPATKCKPVSRK